VFIYSRRKFIPPFFDTYQDFLFLIYQVYKSETKENTNIPDSVVEILENAVDSLYTKENIYSETDYKNYLEQKFDALLVDEDTMEYFTKTLKIYPKEIFKNMFDYIYKLMCALKDCYEFKTDIYEHQKTLLNIINKLYKSWGDSLNQK